MNQRESIEAAIDDIVGDPDHPQGGRVWVHRPGCDEPIIDGRLCPCRPRALVIPPKRVGEVLAWAAGAWP